MIFLGILIGIFLGIGLTTFSISHCNEDKFNQFMDVIKKARKRNDA